MNQYERNRQALVDYLDGQGWSFNVRQDDGTFVAIMRFNVDSELKTVGVRLTADDSLIESRGVCLRLARREAIPAVARLVADVNSRVAISKFHLDAETGEVYTLAALPSTAGEPDRDALELVVCLPILLYDFYGDALQDALEDRGELRHDSCVTARRQVRWL